MKTLVISDLHLTPEIEEKKFLYLNKLFLSYDQIILNGDFWEGFLYSFDDFYNSSWNKLFPMLRQKNTVYIFGNHDKKIYNNLKKAGAFSTIQTEKYEYSVKNKKFIFEHGDRLWRSESEDINLSSTKFRNMVKIFSKLESKLINVSGNLYQKGLKMINQQVYHKVAPTLKNNEYFFFGHTHCQEVFKENRIYNSGVCKAGLSQYIVINEDSIVAKEEVY
jgi:predicted phosphodiesterase